MNKSFIDNILGLDERSKAGAVAYRERDEFLSDPEIRESLIEWVSGIKSDAGLIDALKMCLAHAKTRVRLSTHWDENHSDETYERD